MRAPRPGSTPSSRRTADRAAARRKAMLITYGDEQYVLAMADLGPEDDRLSRGATGFVVSELVREGKMGLDSLAVLVWTARRKAGYREVYREFEQDFPGYLDAADMMEDGRLAVREVDIDPDTGRAATPIREVVSGELAEDGEGGDPLP